MTHVRAYAILAKGEKLNPYDFELPEIGEEEVDIQVEHCGICHSDLSMIDNEWGMTHYPLVAGHEVIGTVKSVGSQVKNVKTGQRVGLGWFSGSCLHCHPCLHGDHNLCETVESTIVGRHGGFADMVRCKSEWAVALPDGLAAADAGPLFCGGITVFNPLVQFDVRPTDRVGVIGIGGLGHMALQFLNKWGCEVTAFSSNPAKAEEAKQLGAHHVINSRDENEIKKLSKSFDFILNTADADLNWGLYIEALAQRGRLHTVGAVPSPIPVPAFALLLQQRSVSGSPLGSPGTVADMLNFAARHGIKAQTEHFAMKDINAALDHVRAGKARYRVVLDYR